MGSNRFGVYRDIHIIDEDTIWPNYSEINYDITDQFSTIESIAKNSNFKIVSIDGAKTFNNSICYTVQMDAINISSSDSKKIRDEALNSSILKFIQDIRAKNISLKNGIIPQIVIEINYEGKTSLVVWADYVYDWYISKQTDNLSGCWGHS
jgi:hypothetical protein